MIIKFSPWNNYCQSVKPLRMHKYELYTLRLSGRSRDKWGVNKEVGEGLVIELMRGDCVNEG